MLDERHDGWKDNYDEWKLASPYDDEPEEECWHEEREIDWEGYATCNLCGKGWFASADEIAMERERGEVYDAYMRREERLDRYWRPLWRVFYRVLAFVWRAKPKPVDDDIPF